MEDHRHERRRHRVCSGPWAVRRRGGHGGDDRVQQRRGQLRDREPSSAPADAAGKVLGVRPTGEAGEARFSTVVHWGYGTSWGAVRGLLHAAGRDGPSAAAAHFTAVWGSAQVMLPALDVAPPPWKSPPVEIAVDAFHHAVYATATSLAFAALQRGAR